ncbi:2Fe-2S iron-sulfur cluster-binding protein [Roseicyclus sp. F158]|uniref:2Fe-2S iron-sulfur cluster-binding protein n=1 Tax=Tropicimonas omnivorans TaxID=3075590 RepID=A0ABU3DGL9_9RHOB|nr:FAD-dependent oxidoreductase [Roseicyclus sp. F158]MDT0682832.1 2Fe-2S iron-sulfur cluster-binding protein [Roseicyclus sp. F158]
MRLETGGLIDRTTRISFRFAGRTCHGHPGDTLASALLAAGVRVVGRSPIYRRPRGLARLEPEEPNGVVVVKGRAIRATELVLSEGLDASPLDRSAWRIGRRADVRAPDETSADPEETSCDVLVVGAGPAGLMAARAAAEAGASVLLVEADARPGGYLLGERETVGGKSGADWAAEEAERLSQQGVQVRFGIRVTTAGGDRVRAVERLPDGTPRLWRIDARALVLACGASEEPEVFPGNDRPGILSAAAVRMALHRFGAAPGARIAVYGDGREARRTAIDLVAAGIEVPALIDPSYGPPDGADLPEGVPLLTDTEIAGTRGRRGLTALLLMKRGETRSRPLRVDALAVSGTWAPRLTLARERGATPGWSRDLMMFLPQPAAGPGWAAAGAMAGAGSTGECLASGRDAARAVLEPLGWMAADVPLPQAPAEADPPRPPRFVPLKGRAFVDLARDMTTADVRSLASKGRALPAPPSLLALSYLSQASGMGIEELAAKMDPGT